MHENGTPFFWLGDTGWLTFQKLDRAEVDTFIRNRAGKGFNVIQMMVLHGIPEVNAYGDSAVAGNNPGTPKVTQGNNPEIPGEYDYWDHVDYVVEKAAEHGIYVGMVACWGSIVKSRKLNMDNVGAYAGFLAKRYRDCPNIVWINGGDIKGSDGLDVWNAMGNILKNNDPNHLVTFHPFGRTQSSTWFHNEPWLDFNMFQSGHRRYDQTDGSPEWKGEDSWRYVEEDYAKMPPKPTVDGEPSYEGIPQGLHDPKEPYWQAQDVRRYAWWGVCAGAFGHTYGNNAVMQMFKPGRGSGAYGVKNYWYEAIDDPGAGQMQYVKKLFLSRPFFERVPDQSLIAANGEKYDYVIATRGNSYAVIYTCSGRAFDVNMGVISGQRVKAWWYSPRDGAAGLIGEFDNTGVVAFVPPGDQADGNDWVLVLDDVSKKYPEPGL